MDCVEFFDELMDILEKEIEKYKIPDLNIPSMFCGKIIEIT